MGTGRKVQGMERERGNGKGRTEVKRGGSEEGKVRGWGGKGVRGGQR